MKKQSRWPHRFSNGVTLGTKVLFKYRNNLIPCRVMYELVFGEPSNLRLMPISWTDDIGKGCGMMKNITEEDLNNEDLIIIDKQA